MSLDVSSLIILSTSIQLFVLTPTDGIKLYYGCGKSNFVCIGTKDNVTSINQGGCIKDKNCQVILRIEKVINTGSNSTSSNQPIKINQVSNLYQKSNMYRRSNMYQRFNWELAIQHSDSILSDNYYNFIYLSISKEKVTLDEKERMEKWIPYISYEKTRNWKYNHFQPRMHVCSAESAADDCDSQLVKLLPEAITYNYRSDFIRFGSIASKLYDDTPLEYFGASGTSNQVINVLIRTRIKNVNYTIDLIKDNLTVSIFHWYGSAESKYWKLVSEARFIEPRLWFQDNEKPANEGNSNEKVEGEKNNDGGKDIDGEKNNGEEVKNSEESNFWIWITICVIGLVIILILIICITFACIESKRNSSNSVNEPVSIGGSVNEPVAMKGKEMSGNERSNHRSESRNIDSKTGSGTRGMRNTRLTYIAELAGYNPTGEPIRGNKTTTVKKHDFKKGFSSVETSRQPGSSSSGG